MTRAADRFQAIVGPHFEALYRAAMRLTRRRQDAEDLVQEVCLRAYRELAAIEHLECVRGWLPRVQYRVFVDGARRRRRSPLEPLPGPAEASELPSTEPDPEELAEGERARQVLEDAWQRLDREQRALLALHAEGYSLSELEAICGASRNAVSARLHRARARLAKEIGKRSGKWRRAMQTES